MCLIAAVASQLFVTGAEAQNSGMKPLRAKVRIIVFTPSDVEPPANTRERIKDVVEYTRHFYEKGMKHWGYPAKQPFPVELDEQGFPEILYIKGEHIKASGKYDKLGFQQEVISAAVEKYKVPRISQIWWIFLYGAVEKGWGRGGGNSIRGGTSTAYLFPDKGSFNPDDLLADGLLFDIKLKGGIHELGHAFGLPHIGPRNKDNMGNSLMGPIHTAYFRRKGSKNKQVYLSEAAAAMLWKHPFFTGTAKDRNRMPVFQFERFQVEEQSAKGVIEVTGKVAGNYPGHSVIVFNETPRKTDYWRQAFVGKLDQSGNFRVTIDEYEKSNGVLRAVVCFNNGVVLGSTGKFGVRNGYALPYKFENGKFIF